MLLLCALAAPWWNIPRDQADSAGMLAHLHALLVDGDLLFDDDYAALNMSPLFAFVTDEGVVSNHWPAGASWLQAPGYALGLLASRALEGLGIGHGDPLGVVPVLGVRAWAMLVLAGIALAVAQLVAAAQLDAGRAGARRAGWGVAAIFVVGTPLLYYATESPLRPHLWGCACTLALVALWWRRSPEHPWARTIALASLAGLATYVRPQLAPLWLLVVHDAWDDGPRRWPRIAVSAAVFVAWPLAHLRTQLWIYGEGLDAYAGEVTHHTGYFLLSTHHGALSWCPVLGLGAVALGLAVARRERGAWLLLALVLLQVWVDGGMRAIEPRSVLGTRTWAGGVSFGPRKLVDVLPLLLPAVASLVARLRLRGQGSRLLTIAALLSLPTLLLHASAWLDPDATTGGIMDGAAYLEALRRPLSPGAWAAAWAQRGVPAVVPAVVSGLVTLPLLLVGWLGAVAIRRRPAIDPLRLAGGLGAGGLLLVHGWLAVVLLRSDAAREAEPERMLRAATRMTGPHLATVRRIPQHHALLRERLGPGAAPP
ncbi:MAG: hypothetical protein H6712_06730 [Myxococcales bacterium]|nr:hypothetical protein [Myxococcales bacterium]